MTRGLDLADIQGNVVRPYGRFGFPFMRHLFFNIGDASAGRRFIERVRHKVTTAERWGAVDAERDPHPPPRPLVATNIGLSWRGLAALELPTGTLRMMPDEFIDGMAKRCDVLGDIGASAPKGWDQLWQNAANNSDAQVHIWVSFNAQAKPDGTPVDELETLTRWLTDTAKGSNGVTLLAGHKGNNAEFQDCSALMVKLSSGQTVPCAKEHFGFTDGIGDPVFAGQYAPDREANDVIGSGKLLPDKKGWLPLAPGEFILGHVNEAQELAPAAPPWSFTRNGSFMAYRKLHQNVGSFNAYVKQQAALYQRVANLDSEKAADETIRAKMVGRWSDGIPLAAAATYPESQALAAKWLDIPAIQLKDSLTRTPDETARLAAYERMLTEFQYCDDIEGAKCPVTAHIRRANPRDGLDPTLGPPPATPPGSALTNRRRILRRGMPYGDSSQGDDQSEHGVVFMAICASLFRQFEFVQQQWIQYGGAVNAGNDTDPVIGLRRNGAKFVIPAQPNGAGTPFICANLPQFIEMRGGEYFFLPSLTALRQIAMGTVDPS
jgi:Dyp-type peroxidase family